MPHRETRRAFLTHSAAGVAVGLAHSPAAGATAMKHPICVTCGMQFAAADKSSYGACPCPDSKAYFPRSEKANTKLAIHLRKGIGRERLGTCEEKLAPQVGVRNDLFENFLCNQKFRSL